MASVVHCKKQPYDVYIGRPSKYQNPFKIGVDGDREEVLLKYMSYVENEFTVEEIIEDLSGKVLGCWCHPKPCHGDILVAIIEGRRLGII